MADLNINLNDPFSSPGAYTPESWKPIKEGIDLAVSRTPIEQIPAQIQRYTNEVQKGLQMVVPTAGPEQDLAVRTVKKSQYALNKFTEAKNNAPTIANAMTKYKYPIVIGIAVLVLAFLV